MHSAFESTLNSSVVSFSCQMRFVGLTVQRTWSCRNNPTPGELHWIRELRRRECGPV